MTATDDSATVIRKHADGAQVFSVLRGGDSATRFELSLPSGVTPVPAGQGYALASPDGSVLFGEIAAPWAVDANGKRLATSYRLKGDTLVQVVDTRGASFPIVADPKVSFGWRVYVRHSKWEIQHYVDLSKPGGAVWVALCALIPWPPAAAACGTLTREIITSIGDTMKAAKRHNQCVEIQYPYNPIPVGWKRYNC